MINILWNFVVYRSKISDVSELKSRLIDEWAQFDQSIVDATIIQWRRAVCAVHSFSTSPNSCHHTTVLSVDVPNCYTTLKVDSIRLFPIALSIQ